jgi:CheY-like chemotaxis protein
MVCILAVDDEPGVLRLYDRVLSKNGVTLITAMNGREAVDKYRASDNIGLIIMDHRLPVMDGLQATREIMALNNSTKILFISADVSIRNAALEAGAWDFLKKPFTLKGLLSKVREGLQTR